MRPIGAAAFALAAALVCSADDKADAADLKAMVGKWKVEKATLGGKDETATVKDLTLDVLPGGKWKMTFGADVSEGTITVDASKSPKELDVKTQTGQQKGTTMKCVYKLDGDTMTVCAAVGGDRPKAFDGKDATHLLIVYTRDKK
ncbi:MAG: TIGR03067 domain-containing protein [Gemmataceae bacterium]|nr:TIGR03067 domain-containing protein [Gemmataceae bacterium]